MRIGQLGRRLSLTAAATTTMLEQEEFRFGLLTDIQYCDCPDAENFAKTEMRRYRGCLDGARSAAARFREERVAFVAQLGDLIDGQNAGKYGAGLKQGRQSEKALGEVLETLGGDTRYVHSIGNHELYSWSLDELCSSSHPLNQNNHEISRDKRSYFSFEIDSWLFVQLNPYEESMMTGNVELLRKHNPRIVDAEPGTVDYFSDLEGDKLRFVPFNGACGREQREWLEDLLSRTEKNVVVFSHLPLSAKAASWRNVAHDAPEILEILETHKDKVFAVFAGHSHNGGYSKTNGISHVTVPALLTHRQSYALVTAYRDRLVLEASGATVDIVGESSITII